MEENKRLAEELKKVRDAAPREAEEKVKITNRKRRDKLKKESDELLRLKAEAEALEQEERNDLIRQIRALERVPKVGNPLT